MSDLDSISGQFWQELAGFSMNFISKIADFEQFQGNYLQFGFKMDLI